MIENSKKYRDTIDVDSVFEAHVKAGDLLRKFILRNGFDI